MKRDKWRVLRYRVQVQWTVLLLLFTLVTTFLTGWILYGQVSDRVIREAWQQQEVLLDSACTALDQQIDQLRSFTWQLNTHTGVQRYLYLKDQTPRDILAKTEIITLLQNMKAFSTTLSDIGIYAAGLDMVITAESSYAAGDYFSRMEGLTLEDVLRIRTGTGAIALCSFAGRASINRILVTDPVLVFISALPMNSLKEKSYAFFHLPMDRLGACLPESGSGSLLLCGPDGELLLPEEGPYGEVSRAYMRSGQSVLRLGGAEYGVLARETASAGLYCMAVVPYGTLLEGSVRLRRTVMLVMSACMAVGLIS